MGHTKIQFCNKIIYNNMVSVGVEGNHVLGDGWGGMDFSHTNKTKQKFISAVWQ
jgi:hypothetical protein